MLMKFLWKFLSAPFYEFSVYANIQMYGKMTDQFVQDDHDFSVCAVSESVQLFTVPTLVCSRLYT